MSKYKILVISPAWIGDMVMTQSLLKRLHAKHPNLMLDVLVPVYMTDLVERMREVNQVITHPFGHGELNVVGRYVLGKSLRAHNYDQVIVTPNSWKSALIPYFTQAPKRTGWRGEWRYGALNDIRILDKQRYPLMVQRLLALAEEPGADIQEHPLWWPKLSVSEEQARSTLAELGMSLPDQPILGLCPGAAFGDAKRWPADYFAEVAMQKINDGWQVWLFGSQADQSAAQVIQEMCDGRCENFIGRTQLGQAIDLLAQCSKVLTNDTGLMHLAAALGKPVVVLYGSSSPEFTPPLSDQATILQLDLECSPCFERSCPLEHLRCLKELTPQQVLMSL